MTETLTERQEKILAFIKRSIQEQGYPPTIREIGEHFGIRSTNGVNDHLKALERKGYLVRGELKSRALSVIEGGKPARFVRREIEAAPEADSGRVVEVPVVGKVAAGARTSPTTCASTASCWATRARRCSPSRWPATA